MTIETSVTRPLAELGPDTALAVLLFDDDPSLEHEPFDHTLRRRVESLLTEAITHMSLYETRALFSEGKGPTLLLTGAGKWNDLDLLGLKRVVAAASRAATRVGFRHLALCDPQRHPLAETAQAAAEGAGYGSYSPALRKTRGEARAELLSLSLATPRVTDAEVQAGFRRGTILADSTRTARDLVNLPPNELTPVSLAKRVRELSIDLEIDVEVIDERGLADRGMGSFLAVAAGSHEPPRLIVMRYRARGKGARLAVVGKGMTFDSGGLSLKPAQQMETMKGDM